MSIAIEPEAGDGQRLLILGNHDDTKCEYASGPAQGLRDTKIGTFPQALCDQAKKQEGKSEIRNSKSEARYKFE